MSETVRNLFDKARALLNVYTEDGVQLPASDYADMEAKAIPLSDMAQKELSKTGRLFNVYEFDNKPAPNLLGLLSNFNAVDYIGTDQYYPSEAGISGAKAFYFEVNRPTAIVTIEELQGSSWVAIATPTITASITSYTGHKGTITPLASTNPIRMKFSGTTHYRHINRCLFSYPFALADIPTYRPWFKITMPANYRNLDAFIEEYPDRQYANGVNYKREGFKDFFINYYYEGNIRITYKPVPTDITSMSDVLEIDDITAQAIVYYVAARLAPFKKKELVQFFESKFLELKVDSKLDMPITVNDITDVYGVGGLSNNTDTYRVGGINGSF
jgi:hypothetical protein